MDVGRISVGVNRPRASRGGMHYTVGSFRECYSTSCLEEKKFLESC